MNKNRTFSSALRNAAKIIRGSGMPETAAYSDARSLLSYAVGVEYNRIPIKLNDNINTRGFNRVMAFAEKRAGGYPLQYITGVQDFYGRDFIVKKGVFIPRFDTQAVIDIIKKNKKHLPENCAAAECGCGTGAICITLLLEPVSIKKIYAYDTSKRAVKNTLLNAQKYNCEKQLKIYEKDFFKAGLAKKDGINLIVSNPPYIAPKDRNTLPKDVLKEPKKALFGVLNGLSYYNRLAVLAGRVLPENGLLAVEIGDDMEAPAAAVCEKQGLEPLSECRDLTGRVRALLFKRAAKR